MEDSETGELLGWFCSSDLMKGRRRPRENEPTYLDRSKTLEFCCHDMSLAALAEAMDDLVEAELVIPKGKYAETVSHSTTATLDEIMGAVGLSVRA
jgi:hypothetical protein